MHILFCICEYKSHTHHGDEKVDQEDIHKRQENETANLADESVICIIELLPSVTEIAQTHDKGLQNALCG